MQRYLQRHARTITLIAGSGLVSLWTVIRHITNGVNFDVVGQVGVASQWANGMHQGTQLGATNYLIKVPLYYLVNHLGFLGPHAKLLVLALLLNIATFVLLVVVFEKILKLYKVRPNTWFYVAMLWLASISGRVYWLDYANSRNIETVGGIFTLYLGMRLLHLGRMKVLLGFISMSGLVFFADPLQLYCIGGGLLLYAAWHAITSRSRQASLRSGLLIGAVASGYALSKLLTFSAAKLLPVSFLTASTARSTLSLHEIGTVLHGLLNSTARIFDSSFYSANSTANQLRELLNAFVLISLVFFVGYAVRHHRQKRPDLAQVIVCCLLATYGAFVASGQPVQANTERYLIMVPLLVVLAFCVLVSSLSIRLRNIISVWTVLILASSVLAAGALVVSWPQRFSKDSHITDTLTFLRQHDYKYAISSRDGILLTYFSDGSIIVIPTICLPNHTIHESNLFFDKAAFADLNKLTGQIPLIVPAGGIVSRGSVCTTADTESQLGQPLAQMDAPHGATIVLYPASQLVSLEP